MNADQDMMVNIDSAAEPEVCKIQFHLYNDELIWL